MLHDFDRFCAEPSGSRLRWRSELGSATGQKRKLSSRLSGAPRDHYSAARLNRPLPRFFGLKEVRRILAGRCVNRA